MSDECRFRVLAADHRYRVGAWVTICGVLMLFVALTSAYIVRSASSNDWRPIILPKVLWLSTAVIMASSNTSVRCTTMLVSQLGTCSHHSLPCDAGSISEGVSGAPVEVTSTGRLDAAALETFELSPPVSPFEFAASGSATGAGGKGGGTKALRGRTG